MGTMGEDGDDEESEVKSKIIKTIGTMGEDGDDEESEGKRRRIMTLGDN